MSRRKTFDELCNNLNDKGYIPLFDNEWYDNTIKEAGVINNISSGNIGMCCKKIRKSAGGFKWKYNDGKE